MPSFASRTMQKLYSARLLAEHLNALEQQDELVRSAFRMAHTEAVLFQMQGALQSLLYEIAEAARLPQGEWLTIEDLQQAADEHERCLPQLNILLELQNDSFSWLNQFQKRYQSCWLPERQSTDKDVHVASQAANLISTAPEEVSEIEQLKLWLTNMQALVNDLRQTMQEF